MYSEWCDANHPWRIYKIIENQFCFIDYSWYLVNVKSCNSFYYELWLFFEIFFAIFVLIEKRLYLCHIKIILYKFWEHFFIIYWTMVAREYLVISHSNCFSFSLSCLFLHSIPVCKESLQANWFLISKVLRINCKRLILFTENMQIKKK